MARRKGTSRGEKQQANKGAAVFILDLVRTHPSDAPTARDLLPEVLEEYPSADIKTVGNALSNLKKAGHLKTLPATKGKRGMRWVPVVKESTGKEVKTLEEPEMPPPLEMPEELEHICFQCNRHFTAAQVGEGILALFKKMQFMVEAGREKNKILVRDHNMAVEENRRLKNLVGEKDKKIIALNKAINEGTKGMDLHALAQFREHLPKNATVGGR